MKKVMIYKKIINTVKVQRELSRTKRWTSTLTYQINHLTNISWNCLHKNGELMRNERIKKHCVMKWDDIFKFHQNK